MSILSYLDSRIELFRQNNNDYPTKIIMSKETHKKIFTELEEIDIVNSWVDNKDILNYRGIKISIKSNIFLELK